MYLFNLKYIMNVAYRLKNLARKILNEISFEVINPESKIPLGFKNTQDL